MLQCAFSSNLYILQAKLLGAIRCGHQSYMVLTCSFVHELLLYLVLLVITLKACLVSHMIRFVHTPLRTEARREELYAIIAQGRLERRLSDRAMKMIHPQQQPLIDNASPSTPSNKVATSFVIPLEPLGVIRNSETNPTNSSDVGIAPALTNEADVKHDNDVPLSKAQQQKQEQQQQQQVGIIDHRVPDFSPMVMKSHSSDAAYNNEATSAESSILSKQVKHSYSSISSMYQMVA
jgi:hypothetical protein